MRFWYLVYQEAREKLKPLNLEERVNNAKKEEDFPYLGSHIYKRDAQEWIKDMFNKEVYNTFPRDEIGIYKKELNEIFQNLDKIFWRVKRNSKIIKEKAELYDLLLMTGCISNLVLKPDEIGDYKKYKFDSLIGFAGAVGAEIWRIFHGNNRNEKKSYDWNSKSKEGREYLNQITGSMHFDLRVYKTDITPDETLDPVGNKVLYRPELNADRQILAGYHSVEGSMLVTVLKYAEQLNLKPSCLNDKSEEFLEWASSLWQRGGGCTEHFGGYNIEPDSFFHSFKYDIPVLDETSRTKKRTPFYISTAGGGAYESYISHDSNLVLSYTNLKEKNEKKDLTIFFQPEDAEHLIKGLIYQSANGIGRTSARQLINIIKYYFSNRANV